MSRPELDASSVGPCWGGTLLARSRILGRPIAAWLCPGGPGQEWDDFLRGCALGQFQQSSLWAQTKEIDGWNSIRVAIEQEGHIVGGFQLLWKTTRLGRIGYVSKGPVLMSEDSAGVAFALDQLLGLVHSYRLRAMIVQPPDQARLIPQALASRGFLPNRLISVISATCMIDVAGPTGEWEKDIGRSRRHEIQQALRSPLQIREGGDSEIPKFFELMASTCARQRTRPNPGSVEALGQLVRAFQASGSVRLSFADYQGEAIACAMALKFGERVTLWKKGWNGTQRNLHPNSLLYYDAVRWAQQVGFKCFDFGGMDRSLAEDLLARHTLTAEQKRSRDVFNLTFGARPKLLSEVLIYWNNAALRSLYSAALHWPWLLDKFGRAAGQAGS